MSAMKFYIYTNVCSLLYPARHTTYSHYNLDRSNVEASYTTLYILPSCPLHHDEN
jgi:hypothetical protein